MAETKTKQTAVLDNYDLVTVLADLEKRVDSLSADEWELLGLFCAKQMLTQVEMLDPRWKRMIEAARVETRRNDWQLLGSWVARVLENATHLNAPMHPFFEPGAARSVEQRCKLCTNEFTPDYPGQAYCSNECGSRAFKEKHAA